VTVGTRRKTRDGKAHNRVAELAHPPPVPDDKDDPGRHSREKQRRTIAAPRPAAVFRWLFTNLMSVRGGTLVIGIALARMTSVREFAAFAVAAIALLAIRSLDIAGIGRAVASWTEDPRDVIGTATTLSVIAGAVISGCGYLAARSFANELGAPDAARVIRVLALTAVLDGLACVPSATLQRRSPRARVAVDQIGNWIGVGTTIGLFAAGHGLTSFAIGSLAGAAISMVLFIALSPASVGLGFRPRLVPVLLGAGLPLAASGVLLFAVTNADLVVIARLMHRTDLGYYMFATCLASWPVTLCSQPVRNSAPAAFARFRGGPRVAGSAFLSSVNLLACLTIPVIMLISGSSKNLIRLTYGPHWLPAAQLLIWLAPLAALRVFAELTHDYLAARDSQQVALAFQAALLVALLPAMVIGHHERDAIGVAVVQVAILTLFPAPWYLREVGRLDISGYLLAARLIACAVVVAAIGWVWQEIQRNLGAHERVAFLAAAVTAFGVTVLLMYRMRALLNAVRRAGVGRSAATVPTLLSVYVPPPSPLVGQLPNTPLIRQAAVIELPVGHDEQAESLGRKVSSGARWSLINTAVLRVANFATGVILARFVFGPQAFGLYAVSQVVLLVLLSANEMGVSLAIVRWEGDVRTFGGTVFTLSVLFSSLFYAALYVTAPSVSQMLGSPAATGMLRVMCLTVIIDGLACVPLALLNRMFLQFRRMLVDSLNFVVSTGVTIFLAFDHKGAISFAWGSVTGCTVALIAATFAAPYIIKPGWNMAQARKLLRFGLPLAGASLLLLGVFNVDSAIVGATLGPVALGFYQLAFNVASWPVNGVLEAARRVSFASFSRVAHSGPLLADAFNRALALVLALAVPVCVLLSTLAEPVLHLVYGEKWVFAGRTLTLLAILGLLRVAYGMAYDLLAAGGRQRALVGVQALWLAALVPALIIGAKTHGIVGVAVGHVLVAGLLVGPAFVWALTRGITSVRAMAAACWRPVAGGILMAAVSLVVIRATGNGPMGLAAAIVAAGCVYVPVVYPMRAMLRSSTPTPETTVSEADAA
jgi:O-antigen/teichoic acid export membrane protein